MAVTQVAAAEVLALKVQMVMAVVQLAVPEVQEEHIQFQTEQLQFTMQAAVAAVQTAVQVAELDKVAVHPALNNQLVPVRQTEAAAEAEAVTHLQDQAVAAVKV